MDKILVYEDLTSTRNPPVLSSDILKKRGSKEQISMAKKKRPSAQTQNEPQIEQFPWSTKTLTPSTTALILLAAVLVRVLVSLGPYSGQSTAPMYGDYEAQRHWMEITINLPATQWYRPSAANNLSYWGLDYPPLTAYQSLLHGFVLNSSVPESVQLISSRGFESYKSKLVMRWTVITSDLMVFFPAAVWFVRVYCRGKAEGSAPWLLAMILLNPCSILIDHGHFQYNCISLGLTLGAIAAVLLRNEVVAAVLFSLAINHKQMSMYFAPAFFGHLLGKCLRRRNPVLQIMKLGIVVLATFAVVWWPYLHSLDAMKEVLSRLAPFERGIYEDYVANFWCSTSVIIKWKKLFSIHFLRSLSFIATVSAFLPSVIHQIMAPSDHGFLYALLNSSFSFYLFSYQVHEKSVLLPLLPASLLAKQEPLLFGWSVYYALHSMYPLLSRDGLVLQYVTLLALFGIIFYSPGGRCSRNENNLSVRKRALMVLPFLCSFALYISSLILQPPKKYPFLFEALIMSLCFSQFVILTCYTNIRQWALECTDWTMKGKKDI